MQPEAPEVRLVKADRTQGILQPTDIDSLIPDDDPAREIWAYVEMLDLSLVEEKIKSVVGEPGRPAIDPRILLALWILAMKEGVGAARHLAELCERHRSYQWICGGVAVHYRTLAKFRTAHPDLMSGLLTQGIAVLKAAGLIELDVIAQDGMKVRASAGRSSFRREASLENCLAEARERVEQLEKEVDADPAAGSRRRQAARKRGRQERLARLEAAAAKLSELQARDEREASRSGKNRVEREKAAGEEAGDAAAAAPTKNRTDEPRVSTTDPDARFMKFPGGGIHPGYNAQFATDRSGVIVGVDVAPSGSDYNQLPSMLDQVKERTGATPQTVLADSGYASRNDVEGAEARGCLLYTPPREEKASTKREHRRGKPDSEAVAAWRQRMKTEEAAAMVRARSSIAEPANARARSRGLYFLTVRGMQKVRTVLTLCAIVNNMLFALRNLSRLQLRPAAT